MVDDQHVGPSRQAPEHVPRGVDADERRGASHAGQRVGEDVAAHAELCEIWLFVCLFFEKER